MTNRMSAFGHVGAPLKILKESGADTFGGTFRKGLLTVSTGEVIGPSVEGGLFMSAGQKTLMAHAVLIFIESANWADSI